MVVENLCVTAASLPAEVNVWIVEVLSPAGVATGERAEEGVGEQTGHLLLRHSDGVAGASFEEGYWLGEEPRRTEEGQNHLFLCLKRHLSM